ncbi:unnamed protein product [Caenorhabditis sp. 36 PRJEB53466]|nr:unnamed protein product [Caenorhabditis sp. 36 PRJEB53466]
MGMIALAFAPILAELSIFVTPMSSRENARGTGSAFSEFSPKSRRRLFLQRNCRLSKRMNPLNSLPHFQLTDPDAKVEKWGVEEHLVELTEAGRVIIGNPEPEYRLLDMMRRRQRIEGMRDATGRYHGW